MNLFQNFPLTKIFGHQLISYLFVTSLPLSNRHTFALWDKHGLSFCTVNNQFNNLEWFKYSPSHQLRFHSTVGHASTLANWDQLSGMASLSFWKKLNIYIMFNLLCFVTLTLHWDLSLVQLNGVSISWVNANHNDMVWRPKIYI